MTKDKYNIDSHKLMYHPDILGRWLAGENIYPLYIEVSPAGACNHRCVYCALDFMGYQNRRLDTTKFRQRLEEMGNMGVKSIMYAGEGEPFLHPDMAEITEATKSAGIDAAFTTNAVLFKPEIHDRVLANTEWLKVSINAGTAETYARIHQTKASDYEKVMANLSSANELRKSKGYRCILGMQILLLPDNAGEVAGLAEQARSIGMDYLVVKPYSQHPQSETKIYEDIKYSDFMYLADELEQYNTDEFSVIFRANAMEKYDAAEKDYCRCMALPFWSYIDSGGNVWGCSMYLEQDRFNLGNINDTSFENIWTGEKRKDLMQWIAQGDFDVSSCRLNCRMDEVNRYLWQLKNPPSHVNFI